MDGTKKVAPEGHENSSENSPVENSLSSPPEFFSCIDIKGNIYHLDLLLIAGIAYVNMGAIDDKVAKWTKIFLVGGGQIILHSSIHEELLKAWKAARGA